MDGRPHGIQMTPTAGGPKYLRTLCWQGTHQCSAFFVPCRTFLIAHDSKCSRPISVVRWVVQVRSQAFVDDLVPVVVYSPSLDVLELLTLAKQIMNCN